MQDLPDLIRRGNRCSASTTFALLVVCGYLLQLFCSILELGPLESWLGLSRNGIIDGCLWKSFTYLFVHQLENPIGIIVTVSGLMLIGRELENIVGPKHFLFLSLASTIMPGSTAILQSATVQMLGAWPVVFGVAVACTAVLPECALSLPFTRFSVQYKFLGVALIVILLLSWVFGWAPSGQSSPVANFIGASIGWIYIHFLGFGTRLPGEIFVQRWLGERRKINRMPAGQYIQQFVDPVLEKIYSEGPHRLTWTERRILRKARQKARRKLS